MHAVSSEPCHGSLEDDEAATSRDWITDAGDPGGEGFARALRSRSLDHFRMSLMEICVVVSAENFISNVAPCQLRSIPRLSHAMQLDSFSFAGHRPDYLLDSRPAFLFT